MSWAHCTNQKWSQLTCQCRSKAVPFGDSGALTCAAYSSSIDMLPTDVSGSSNMSDRPYCSSRLCHFSVGGWIMGATWPRIARRRYSESYKQHKSTWCSQWLQMHIPNPLKSLLPEVYGYVPSFSGSMPYGQMDWELTTMSKGMRQRP